MAKPANCSIELLTIRPTRPFNEIGMLDKQGLEPVASAGEFLALARPLVCSAGGDAILTEQLNGMTEYYRAVVIKYR